MRRSQRNTFQFLFAKANQELETKQTKNCIDSKTINKKQIKISPASIEEEKIEKGKSNQIDTKVHIQIEQKIVNDLCMKVDMQKIHQQNLIDKYTQLLELFECKYIPADISFREEERKDIQQFLIKCLNLNESISNYNTQSYKQDRNILVSGLPGCGKTLLINNILKTLSEQNGVQIIKKNAMEFSSNVVSVFQFIKDSLLEAKYADAAKIDEAYINHNQEQKKLLIAQIRNIISSPKQNGPNVIIFFDEIDNLFNNGTPSIDMFELFNFANLPQSRLVLLGVSNTMELIFNLSNKHKIDLSQITNIVFKPYSLQAIQVIAEQRLLEYNHLIQNENLNLNQSANKIFDNSSIRLAAGKILSVKGSDIRCLFDVIKYALHQKCIEAKQFLTPSCITLPDLIKVFKILYPPSQFKDIIQTLPPNQQMLLAAMHNQVKVSGKQVVALQDVLNRLNYICMETNIPKQSMGDISEPLSSIEQYKIIELFNTNVQQKQNNKKSKQKNMLFTNNYSRMFSGLEMIEVKIKPMQIVECLNENELISKYLV